MDKFWVVADMKGAYLGKRSSSEASRFVTVNSIERAEHFENIGAAIAERNYQHVRRVGWKYPLLPVVFEVVPEYSLIAKKAVIYVEFHVRLEASLRKKLNMTGDKVHAVMHRNSGGVTQMFLCCISHIKPEDSVCGENFGDLLVNGIIETSSQVDCPDCLAGKGVIWDYPDEAM